MRLGDVYASPGHLMRRAQQIAVAIFHEELRGFDMTPVQFAALTAIKEHRGIDQRGLVDAIAIDRSTVGSMLSRLEAKKLITRTTPKHNQRVKQLAITAKGQALLRACRRAIDRSQDRILAPLSARERALFMRLLARLVHINNEASRVPLKLS